MCVCVCVCVCALQLKSSGIVYVDTARNFEWVVLVGYYGISTLVGYLILNLVNTFIKYI